MDHDVQISRALPDQFRNAAAKLYYIAFRQKLHPIFRDELRGTRVLEISFNPDYAIIATIKNKLVGIAGFKDFESSLVNIKPQTIAEIFGWGGGLLRLLALSVIARPIEKGTMLMDGIVVDPDVRGMGVGSMLLDAVIDVARQKQFRQVRLDVVDTNPRARQLYERKGFIATKSQRYPYLSNLFGFSGSTTMLKAVDF